MKVIKRDIETRKKLAELELTKDLCVIIARWNRAISPNTVMEQLQAKMEIYTEFSVYSLS